MAADQATIVGTSAQKEREALQAKLEAELERCAYQRDQMASVAEAERKAREREVADAERRAMEAADRAAADRRALDAAERSRQAAFDSRHIAEALR